MGRGTSEGPIWVTYAQFVGENPSLSAADHESAWQEVWSAYSRSLHEPETFYPYSVGSVHIIADPPKRPQRGGVPKGKSWTHVAAIHFANALMCRRQSMRTLYRMTMLMALDTIYRHARKPATRAEAKRLLAVLEARR